VATSNDLLVSLLVSSKETGRILLLINNLRRKFNAGQAPVGHPPSSADVHFPQ
jgi:hypothetical protein